MEEYINPNYSRIETVCEERKRNMSFNCVFMKEGMAYLGAGFALDIEDLHDEFMFTGSDNKDCEEAYNCYDEVSKLKNKVDYYMDQISKSE